MTTPRYGLDTGFFFRLFDGGERARAVWSAITAGEATGVGAALSVYELQRNALKGVLVRDDVDAFLDELPHLCTMRESLSTADGRHAARLAWGNGLAMADALILQAFLAEEVTRVLTTDHDLAAYDGAATIEVL